MLLESDSRASMDLIPNVEVYYPYYNLIIVIREYTSKDWECKLQHVWSEGNQCTDYLAKSSISNEPGLKVVRKPPIERGELLGANILGVATLHLVTV